MEVWLVHTHRASGPMRAFGPMQIIEAVATEGEAREKAKRLREDGVEAGFDTVKVYGSIDEYRRVPTKARPDAARTITTTTLWLVITTFHGNMEGHYEVESAFPSRDLAEAVAESLSANDDDEIGTDIMSVPWRAPA